mmetsp:Transcript_20244/g.51453  ORF Transcript_20244/g.51453 Transcript_20244/m.51453 type:complete len:267 (+) Transcript_20244:1646-2446(+)
MVAIRSGMLLAAILGRQFVMPRVACLFDRYWAEHNGTHPLSSMSQPFNCPQDYVFELNQIKDYEQWIPRVHNFLQHPAMPAAVRRSAANVSLGGGSAPWRLSVVGEAGGPRALAALVARLRVHSAGPSTARQANAPWAHDATDLQPAVVLGVEGIPDIFRLLPETEQRRFEQFSKKWFGIMCCTWAPPRGAGHVHYDLFWDLIPHTDQLGRTFTKEWVPLFGRGTQRLTDCEANFTEGEYHTFVSFPSHVKQRPGKQVCGKDVRPL